MGHGSKAKEKRLKLEDDSSWAICVKSDNPKWCPFCEKEFPARNKLIYHVQNAHSKLSYLKLRTTPCGEYNWRCNICGFYYKSRWLHQKGTGEKTNCEKAIALAKGTPYEFTPDETALVACDTELSIKERSGAEIASVRRKVELECPECDRVYTGSQNLYIHIRNAHGLKVLIKYRMTEIPGKQDVKCEKCGWYYVYHVNPNHSCEQNRLDSMLLSVKCEKTFVEGKFEFKCGNCKHYFEDQEAALPSSHGCSERVDSKRFRNRVLTRDTEKGTVKPGYGSSKRPFKCRPFKERGPRKKRRKVENEDESEASEPEESQTTDDEKTEGQEEVHKAASEPESETEPEIELNLSDDDNDADKETEPVECPECRAVISNLSQLYSHLRVVHGRTKAGFPHDARWYNSERLPQISVSVIVRF